MSIPVIYTDSDKSKYFSTDDFVTMENYNHSFYSAPKMSQYRMVIVPGSAKQPTIPQPVQIQPPQTQPSQTQSDDFDYVSYPKK